MAKKTEKTEINYRPVVFKDSDADFAFLTRSTVETRDTIVWTDGNEYHYTNGNLQCFTSIFTGQQKFVDNQGRVDRSRVKSTSLSFNLKEEGKIDVAGFNICKSS